MKLTDMERDVRFSIIPRRGSTSTISFDPSARDAIRLAVARWRRCVGMTVSPSFSSETTSSDLPTERQIFLAQRIFIHHIFSGWEGYHESRRCSRDTHSES